MHQTDLQQAIDDHRGTFDCEALSAPATTRQIAFRHHATAPRGHDTLPDVPGLRDFYRHVGSVLFYADAGSGEAALWIAPPSEWAALQAHFNEWTADLDADERADSIPGGLDTAQVIGEEPGTGNYLLIATGGTAAGHVFLFDHDGFEFTEQAPDLVSYAWKLLDPDDSALLAMATHLRFIRDDDPRQWWIRELRDNRGNVARTHE